MQALRRLQSLLGGTKPDAGMASALPQGAWWEHVSNMSSIVIEPYGADAGDAAVVAARSGPLELHDVCFTYPLRPTAHGDGTEAQKGARSIAMSFSWSFLVTGSWLCRNHRGKHLVCVF